MLFLPKGASSGHTGDDISVEAIAASNPDWIIVLDRDAAMKDQTNYVSAKELISASPALQNVPAVQKGQIIYLPGDFYTTESIQAYTKVLQLPNMRVLWLVGAVVVTAAARQKEASCQLAFLLLLAWHVTLYTGGAQF